MYKRAGLDAQVQTPQDSRHGRVVYAPHDYGLGTSARQRRWATTTPHLLRWYFHTETTLQGAPAPPAGSLTLSELVPDKTDADPASIAGGHTATSASVATSQWNSPTSKPNVGVAGNPPLVDTPIAAHQGGWFSDIRYTGRFQAGVWTFNWREDDNASGVAGVPVINIFAAGQRDFSAMRFITQIQGAGDWWTSGTAVGAWTSQPTGVATLNNEYIFLQLWCLETAFSPGTVLTFHQEGSDLSDAARSSLISPTFHPGTFIDAPPFVRRTQRAAPAQAALSVWYQPGDGESRFIGLEDPRRPYFPRRYKHAPAYYLSKTIRAVTRDETGAVLPFCRVLVFRSSDNTLIAQTVSDANGNWNVTVPS